MSLALQSSGLALRYVSQVALARWLGPTAFGSYAYALNMAQLVASPCDLGGATSGVRFVPQYQAAADRSRLHGVVRFFTVTPLVAGTVAAAIAMGAVVVFGPGPSSTPVMLLALALIPAYSLAEVVAALNRGFRDLVAAYFPTLVLQPLLVVGAVAIAFVAGDRLTARRALEATALAVVVVLALQLVLLRTQLRRSGSRARPVYAIREWTRVSLPLLAMNSVQLVFQRVDVVVVGLVLGAKQAGIYAVAFRTAGLASVFQTAMNAAVAPQIGQLFWGDRRGDLERTVLRAVRRIFPPSLAVTVVLVVLGRPILGVFGPAFAAGWPALAIYAAGQLASVSAGPVGWMLNLTGHQTRSALVTAATAALALAGYVVLIPLAGIAGAAAANAGAVVVKNIWMSRLVRQHLGLRISLRRALWPDAGGPHRPAPPGETGGTT